MDTVHSVHRTVWLRRVTPGLRSAACLIRLLVLVEPGPQGPPTGHCGGRWSATAVAETKKASDSFNFTESTRKADSDSDSFAKLGFGRRKRNPRFGASFMCTILNSPGIRGQKLYVQVIHGSTSVTSLRSRT